MTSEPLAPSSFLLGTSDLFFNGRWDFALISVIFFVAFLLLIPFKKKTGWKAHGTYTAFIIALFAEMYGFPLTIFLISSYFGQLGFSLLFIDYMSLLGMPIGLIITTFGMVLVVSGWKAVHKKSREDDVATKGIYSRIRHPQYLGFILMTLGWLIHWPTIPTAIMWPILVAMYYKLAKREEKEMVESYGERYLQYKRKVPMFIPRLKSSPKPLP
jgi:methanethiol S-methyltransferase